MIRRTLRIGAFLLVVACPVAAQQPVPPPRDLPRSQTAVGTGAITGIVRAADTGMPLRGVDIRLTGTGVGTGVRGAFTDASGRYEFLGLPEGQYTLIASKVRYMTMTYGQTRTGEEGRRVEVASGQRVANVDFALPAGAVIVLRVGDRFGDPAVGFQVNLFQATFAAGKRTLTRVPLSNFGTRTDDRGEIRLSGLAPGEYYVSAGGGLGPPPSVATPAERDVETFYPGTPANADAQAITVGIGDEVVVAFDTVGSRMVRASGTIVGGGARPDVRLGRRALGSGLNMVNVNVTADGSFSASSLPPGDYEMTASTETELGTLRFALASEDVSGLVLTMNPVVPLRGKITFEGTPPAGALAGFVLRPAFTETAGLPYAAQIRPDWTFEIRPFSGSGVLRAELPRGWFLKAVRLDGRDVTDTILDFESYQGKPIEVVFTQKATEIAGRVVDATGREVSNYVAVAFPEDQQRWTPLTRTIASVRPDQQGRFNIRGLPPGRYMVVAVDYLQSGQERDPKTLERLRARATAVALSEGGVQNLTLALTP